MEEDARTTDAVESAGPPIRVLIVDNDEALARAMEESLVKVGYECVVATSGPQGARKIETDTFDCIVTDLVMNDVDGMEILGKPHDNAEAIAMLTRLRGHTHQVYTGIALLRPSDGLLLQDLCVTDVPMRAYSDEEIFAYVATGDPLDKAGAYAIQHSEFHPVANLDGCYASVMGLPMCHVILLLRKMNIQPNADVFAGCETLLEYQCPVSNAILSSEI